MNWIAHIFVSENPVLKAEHGGYVSSCSFLATDQNKVVFLRRLQRGACVNRPRAPNLDGRKPAQGNAVVITSPAPPPLMQPAKAPRFVD